MDPSSEVVPERSNLWLSGISQVKLHPEKFDKTAIAVSFCLAFFSFILLWPIVSQINFEEAFFTPLVPFLISIFEFFKLGPSDSLKILFIVSFMISTIGVYLFTFDLVKRHVTAILASIIYLIPPIPVFVLTYFRNGLLERELASAKSFFTIIYGDGAHFLALAMIPFACFFVLRYLKFSKRNDLVLSTILCSLILLANASQAVGLGLILFMILLTQLFFGNARAKLAKFFTVIILSVGLVSFWYTPHFWYFGTNFAGSQFFENIQILFPLPFILFVLALFFSFVFFARREDRMAIFVSFLIFIVFFGICASWLVSGRSFLPHPHRMLPDLTMFSAIVLALVLTALFDRLHFPKKIKVSSSGAKIIAGLAFGIVSFLILSLAAYIVSPSAILAVSGERGIWAGIRMSILSDRQETLNLAGGNFKLVSLRGENWQVLFGTIVSAIFLLIILWLILTNLMKEEGAE